MQNGSSCLHSKAKQEHLPPEVQQHCRHLHYHGKCSYLFVVAWLPLLPFTVFSCSLWIYFATLPLCYLLRFFALYHCVAARIPSSLSQVLLLYQCVSYFDPSRSNSHCLCILVSLQEQRGLEALQREQAPGHCCLLHVVC